ncbi:hypothetical protein ANACOL_01240 [Anaerotruncus colihominis DSM 17241]|uniref:Uncharacterized protein n=1 Tax=Anaerotruncus colihominis DSM 17241 TaxID=445972 RepID=B0P8Z5_9FIRM|nr:hypothetical protein ANACOL_01240 [Anaerotruncus colihominis DSM 17241]
MDKAISPLLGYCCQFNISAGKKKDRPFLQGACVTGSIYAILKTRKRFLDRMGKPQTFSDGCCRGCGGQSVRRCSRCRRGWSF